MMPPEDDAAPLAGGAGVNGPNNHPDRRLNRLPRKPAAQQSAPARISDVDPASARARHARRGGGALSASTPLDHARDLLERGLAPIPVPHKAKAPCVRGWHSLRLTIDDLPRHFGAPPANIGALLGEPSSWIVDVDLDHRGAVALADRFLPPTGMVWGREGKPRSHRLYRLTRPAETRKWASRPGGMILELRSTGCQSIAPGSTHPSGEAVRWDHDGEPALIDPEALVASCDALAVAVRTQFSESAKPTTKDPIDPADPVNPVDPVDPVRMTVDDVLAVALVDRSGQHDAQTLTLARGLKWNVGLSGVGEARPAFGRWWERTRPFCSDQDPDAAWFKFERAWATATIPLGCAGVAAATLRELDRLAAVACGEGCGPNLRRLVNALCEMGRRTSGAPFALSARMAADACGVGVATAHEWLGGLERVGLIRCVDRGRAGANGAGRARRLVWVGCQKATCGVCFGHGSTDEGDCRGGEGERSGARGDR